MGSGREGRPRAGARPRDGPRVEYPELEPEDVNQVLAYAAAALDDKVIDLPKSA